ncbi:DMT family transporter [Bosea sp. 124]|uniref:DMT family transporter n=1 Tax=Bosea sp. 124 TaxID=2135642 RepID=UPI000D45A7EC|nr:DMT family transporter [Bosea sp. 124]PTM38646.1 drug/metabolite transporter (DMT)-like permease [Bosea sp. 124]
MASHAENRRGIIAMLMAMTFFVGNDTLMKLAREVYPVGQAITLRTIFALFTALCMVLAFQEGAKLRLAMKPILLLRGVIDAVVALTFIWALAELPLANVTAILLASPLIIVVLAVVLRIERVGWRRTGAIVVGFCGVLIVLRPATDGFSTAALVALASAVLASCRDLLTRSIGNEIPASVIALTTTAIVGLVACGYGLFEVWVPIWRRETLYLAGAAVMVAAGGICIISAYRNTDVGLVSGYRYAIVILAVIAGYAVWGHVPDPIAGAGIALIVASGLYTMHRQRVLPASNLKIASGPPS